MKVLYCRDAGFNCEGAIRGTSDDEVLTQAAKHAFEVHGVSVTPELAEQLQTLIKEEEPE